MNQNDNQELTVFKEELHPNLISSLYHNIKYSTQAILEIIDNAVDDLIPDQKMHITVDLQKNGLVITNHGGQGMGKQELNSFFKWGYSEKRGKLGRYGLGGKAAMGYLGKSWKIKTIKAGEGLEYSIEEPNWDDRSGGLKEYTPVIKKIKPRLEGLVEIDISKLKRQIQKSELKKLLAAYYRPLIKDKKIEFYSSINETIPPLNFPLSQPEEYFEMFISKKPKLKGWLSLLEKGSKLRGGVRCYSFGRLIVEREFFGPKDPGYKASIDQLIGELFIDWEDLSLTTNKSDYDRDSEEWKLISSEMLKIIDPYIKLLLEEKEKDLPSEQEQKIAKYSGDVWGDFLKSLLLGQKNGSLPGLPIDHGQKPREEKNGDKEIIKTPIQENKSEREQYEPATPPPMIKVGKRKRTGSFPKPLPWPLPETVRYQLGNDNGIRVIKINTRFPIYKLRKNQLSLYIWETLALEYAKSEDKDTQNVEEYIEECNELLHELGIFLRKNKIKIP